MPVATTPKTSFIRPLETEVAVLPIIGDTPLVIHNFSYKHREEMRKAQMGKAKGKKPKKDPKADYYGAMYRDKDGNHAVKSLSFKSAAVAACRLVDGITMTAARQLLHVKGDFTPIMFEEWELDDNFPDQAFFAKEIDPKIDPRPIESPVRLSTGVADLRYRPIYENWRCVIEVEYFKNALSHEQLMNLFNHAGFSCGVGEHRPERNGNWGRFHVADVHEALVGENGEVNFLV